MSSTYIRRWINETPASWHINNVNALKWDGSVSLNNNIKPNKILPHVKKIQAQLYKEFAPKFQCKCNDTSVAQS